MASGNGAASAGPAPIFQGLKVADFTWAGTGPLAISYLARYGAEVIKVESRTRPDWLRLLPPFRDDRPGLDRSSLFASMNGGKRSICVNLNHPKGVALAQRIVAWADVVGESFTAGTMERWGLGYEQVCQWRPDIVMFSTCMQGQTGPFAKQPGYGVPLTALSGLTHITGWPDRTPAGPYGPYTDFIAPRFCLLAVVAALDHRRRTGQGQHLDLSQLEEGIYFLGPLALDYTANGRDATRAGNRLPPSAPHGGYRCRGEDCWCVIAIATDEQWRAFGRAIGEPEWAREDRFATMLGRVHYADDLDRHVEEWTSERTPEEVMSLLQAAGVPAGVVETGEDICRDPQLEHYGYFQRLEHPELLHYRDTKPACTLSKASPQASRAPLLGEHAAAVCTEMLGFTDEEFAALVAEGAIE